MMPQMAEAQGVGHFGITGGCVQQSCGLTVDLWLAPPQRELPDPLMNDCAPNGFGTTAGLTRSPKRVAHLTQLAIREAASKLLQFVPKYRRNLNIFSVGNVRPKTSGNEMLIMRYRKLRFELFNEWLLPSIVVSLSQLSL
jgi:hypothetical protein